MNSLSHQQKEELRRATRDVLARVHPAAWDAETVHRRVAREIEFKVDVDDIKSSLMFLGGMTPPRVKSIDSKFGASVLWVATVEAQLEYEKETA